MARRLTTLPRATLRPHRRIALGCVAVALATLAACADQGTAPSAAAPSLASSSSTPFDLNAAPLTLAWQSTARHLVATHPAFSPIIAGRLYALYSVGQYGAVVAADEAQASGGGGRALYEARRGAIAGASAAILAAFFPDAATMLDDQLASDGAAGPGGTHPHFTRGVAIGREMAARISDRAAHDGFSLRWNGLQPPDPLGGGWVGNGAAPAGFQYPAMRPWYLTSQDQFRPPPPPARGSADFLADLGAVRVATTGRTPADSLMANFWNFTNGTITPLGYWDERAAEYVAAAGLDEREAAHVFALVNSTAADATIGCWEAKYHYMLIRPSRADATIRLVGGVPGFPYNLPNHPSYPSGHSCVSASAARVIEHFFPASTATLEAMVAEAGRSRVVGGIHYPFDISAGQALGRAVADWAIAYDRQPGGLLAALQR
ncbi:MAG TPA: vanadium-dependent haloperoxidase [Gemmatimonadaceae bacterium]|nr:vanadium-dependent haloperoxidase [Gemmatimonadaceae bacterium]